MISTFLLKMGLSFLVAFVTTIVLAKSFCSGTKEDEHPVWVLFLVGIELVLSASCLGAGSILLIWGL